MNANDHNKIQNETKNFYESLFKKGDSKAYCQINAFLDKFQLLKLRSGEISQCEYKLTEKEQFISLLNISSNKSPGNDGLTKDFFVTFRME